MKKTVLVSGASGIVGYGILRSLGRSGLDLNLIGTSIYEDSVAEAFCNRFVKAPITGTSSYLDWLSDTVKEHEVDLLIPGIEADVFYWSEHIKLIQGFGSKVLLNRSELISLCKDKWEFFEQLSGSQNRYAIPSLLESNFELAVSTFGLPLLLKPRQGYGSKGIVVVKDENTFDQHAHQIGQTLMVQPYIGDNTQEYTTSAYCNGEGGFYAHMSLRRELSKDGYTEKAELCEPEGIEQAIESLCELFRPIGPTNFQFRATENGLKLLEINPRISSSTSIRAAFGYNEAMMAVQHELLDVRPTQPVLKSGRAIRYTEDHIFYS
jgi:carbamoyl-phosphate synthase large subunit